MEASSCDTVPWRISKSTKHIHMIMQYQASTQNLCFQENVFYSK